MHITFTLSYGQVLTPGLPYFCRAIGIDNPGWQWVHVPEANAWIAPFTRGAVIALPQPNSTPIVDTTPPSGSLVQTKDPVTGAFTQIGDVAQLRFHREGIPPSPGYPIPLPTNLTGQLTWSFSGVPSADPFTILASNNLQHVFGSLIPNVNVDNVAVTLAYQSVNVPLGVVTLNAQFGNGPLLPIPPNGLLQQSFPTGAQRTFVPRTPLLSPLLTIESAGAGSIPLTTGAISIQAQATYQLAIV